MKVLHLAVHLGGGIGKAHAALAPHLPADVRQRFVLLQQPIDNRHVDTIMRHGGEIIVGADAPIIRRLIVDADVVQFEYWGHPALDELIAQIDLPQASGAGRISRASASRRCRCHFCTRSSAWR